jgi:ATPase subunit of ABC transporter with duplicated ATPase domains
MAWKAGVSAEVIGLPSGSIGERLYQAKLYLATGDLFCWTGVIVALSFGFEKLVLHLLARFESGLANGYSADPSGMRGSGHGASRGSTKHPDRSGQEARPAIRLENVGFGYAGKPVLEGVTASGTSLLVTGVNGAGKTTLLKLILGLLRPTVGTLDYSAWATRAAVFQDDRLVEHLSPIGNIRLAYPGPIGNGLIEAELAAVGLPEDTWARSVRNLSGGQRRRVCLVRALITGADLVCLDEPFTGIDAESLPALRRYARDRLQGSDFALVTHDEADLAAFDGKRLELPRR